MSVQKCETRNELTHHMLKDFHTSNNHKCGKEECVLVSNQRCSIIKRHIVCLRGGMQPWGGGYRNQPTIWHWTILIQKDSGHGRCSWFVIGLCIPVIGSHLMCSNYMKVK